MKKLFDETSINGLQLKNRLVRSATWEGMCADDGRPTEKLACHYRDLAEGGVGLIITGYAFVRSEGKQLPGKMGIHTDDFEVEMKRLTDTVHTAGGAIAIQLVHAGGQTNTATAGRKPLAPSAVKVDMFPEEPEELTEHGIGEIVRAFADGAARAKRFGFDAIELHGAHGYLINQFLSPLTNRRTDRYGGDIENRARFLMEVCEAIRNAVGDDFPVMIKLGCSDFLDGGFETEDALKTARLLDKAGIDAIEISGGTSASGKRSPVRDKITEPSREAYNLPLALEFRAAVDCPIMVVGGFRSLEVIESALEAGMDHISISRPFIREPGLANRWKSGDREKAHCRSCNRCFLPGLKEGGIYCVVAKEEVGAPQPVPLR